MKILLVDDHPIFLEGIKNLLLAAGMHIIETASDGMEALQKSEVFMPDVILMDIMMKPLNGLETTRMIKNRFSNIKIIILTASESDEHLFEAVKCGASGYLLKSVSGVEFSDLLARFEDGEIPCSPGLATQLLEEFKKNYEGTESDTDINKTNSNRIDTLSKRQREILFLIAGGMKYKEVAATLGITERTVKYNMETILNNLHMCNRQEAVKYVIQKGLIE